jgi:N-acetylmuramoyl-L-alanine amidase
MSSNRVFLKRLLNITSIIFMIGAVISLDQTRVYGEGSDYIETWQQQKVILLDPGHGGMDGGASSKDGILEKNINLDIGLKTKELLEKEGYKVQMTREEDKWLCTEGGTIRKRKLEDLESRYKLKNESGCDLFVSIHLNAFPQTQYYGAQVWYGDNDKSKSLAKVLQKSFRDNLDKNNNRLEKPARNSYKILRNSGDIPAVLAECGFLSNVEEAKKLNSKEYQQKIAESIVEAINIYFATEGVS